MSGALLITLLTLFALGVPIAVALALACVTTIVGFTNLPLLLVPQQLFIAIAKWPLVAVPFFILAGLLMDAGGISHRLVDLAKSLLGRLQGALAVSSVLACMVFAAISGSSVATVFAVGAIIVPAMVRHGYPAPFAAALLAAAAELGVIIPPSIPMILYGVAADVSIGELFVAGIGPGLMIGAALALYAWCICRRRGWGRADGADRLALRPAIRRSSLALGMPGLVLGGIYAGAFTPTEASVVAVAYALGLGLAAYRSLRIDMLVPLFGKAVVGSSSILFIIAAAGACNFLITRAGVPAAVGAWIAAHFADPPLFLLAVNVLLFVIGMFVETSASILVLAPILAPVAIKLGIDPVHFGVVMVVNLALGMITPPFGVNLFAACRVATLTFDRLFGELIPLVGVVLICLIAITYLPVISLGLRDLVF